MVNTPVWTKWRKVPNSNPTRWKYVESNVQIHGSSDEWYTYTYSRPWDTTRGFSSSDRGGANTKVWGHNGPYKLQVLEVGEHTSTPPYASYNTGSLKWQKIPQSGPAQQMSLAFPDPFKVNVQNLVITDVSGNAGNADYIKFDPDSINPDIANPKISFKIQDNGDPHHYRYYVHLRQTKAQNWTAEGYLLLSGNSYTTGVVNVVWSDLLPDGNHAPPGTYAFDIHVLEYDNLNKPSPQQLDEWFLKMSYRLKIDVANTVVPEGHTFDIEHEDATEQIKAKGSFVLTDSQNKNGTSLQIDVIDSNLATKATYSSDAVITTPHPVGAPGQKLDLYTVKDDDPAGVWRSVYTGEDSHGVQYRDHKNKRMLAMNKTAKRGNAFHIQESAMKGEGIAYGYLGEQNPLALTARLKLSFKNAGWDVLDTSKLKVSNPDAVKMPFHFRLDESLSDDLSRGSFKYYDVKDELRVVHVIGAVYKKDSGTAQQTYSGFADEKDRYTVVYVADIRAQANNHEEDPDEAVQKVTIHEVGHQLLAQAVHGDGHHRSDPFGTSPTYFFGEEQVAIQNMNWMKLANWRGGTKNDPATGKPIPWENVTSMNQFLVCIMDSSQTVKGRAFSFCKEHAAAIRGYDWDTKETSYTKLHSPQP